MCIIICYIIVYQRTGCNLVVICWFYLTKNMYLSFPKSKKRKFWWQTFQVNKWSNLRTPLGSWTGVSLVKDECVTVASLCLCCCTLIEKYQARECVHIQSLLQFAVTFVWNFQMSTTKDCVSLLSVLFLYNSTVQITTAFSLLLLQYFPKPTLDPSLFNPAHESLCGDPYLLRKDTVEIAFIIYGSHPLW